MHPPPPHTRGYRAFLLRCWLEGAKEERTAWRFSLEPVGGGKRLGFSNLGALVKFLSDAIDQREPETK